MRTQVDRNSVCVFRCLRLSSSVLMALTQLIVQIELHGRLRASWFTQNLLLMLIGDVKRLDTASMSWLLETTLCLMTSHNLAIACDTAATTSGLLTFFVRALVTSREFVCYCCYLILGRVRETSNESIIRH